MANEQNQRNIFDFFSEHLEIKDIFTKEELEAVTDWSGQTFATYFSKQFKPFVVEDEPGRYRVSEAFRRYNTWKKFREHVTQVKRVTSVDYTHKEFSIVRIFEFFMPLSNEAILRKALDALFFKDTIIARLKTIKPEELRQYFPKNNDSNDSYYDNICDWISKNFGGYSVYHVNGRFRTQELASRVDIGNMLYEYLVDETTAVTRFIFPCEDDEEAEKIGFFFYNLFVKAIIEVINGEDEIWMVETGIKTDYIFGGLLRSDST